MRIAWISLTLLLIGLLLWAWGRAPITDVANQLPAAGAASAPIARHATAASAAVRRTHGTSRPVPKSEDAQGPAGPVTTAAPARTTGAAVAPARVALAAPAEEPSAPPQAAGELFNPFIADDPHNVFAPATANYHAAVQGETQDPDWGPAAASALRNYIADRFGERFEMPYVDCRQDLCELQVAGRIGGDRDADMHDVQDAMALMKHEPWWTTLEFDQESGMVTAAPDGRVILLWFFSRK